MRIITRGSNGDKGAIHQSKEKPSNRAIPGKIKGKAIERYRSPYQDFNPTLISTKWLQRDGIRINEETLPMGLIDLGDWKKTRKQRGHRPCG